MIEKVSKLTLLRQLTYFAKYYLILGHLSYNTLVGE